MVIIVIGMLGLLEAVNVAMEHNLRNQLRDQAVYVGEKILNDMRGQQFDATFTNHTTIPMSLRGVNKKFTVDTTTIPLGADSKQYEVVVKWTYKSRNYQNQVVTVRSR
ncbi:pilus assembly protein PilV [Geobacter luticola]|uniref:Pilus assembly protein PilV n=2 Tax=Geomobilimonas luticola TaxID=1114878 RepID=A0ABS5SBR8_9BACT|nr:pilus assembly protein PilV [Geomobilimonas luticola]